MSHELVNKETGEIAEIQQTPEVMLLAARDAARSLKSVIDSNDRPPVSFGGKQYLEYPHWQTIAKFYHCSVATEGAEFVEIQGVPGFKAKAVVIDDKTGIKIGSAEAYCLKDEPNWKNKPMFQLASMAQTRAGAKALANKFRYVAIVAGYEPTPKEEMDGIEIKPSIKTPQAKPIEAQVVKEEIPFGEGKSNIAPISDKQRKLLWAKCRAAKVPEEVFKAYIKDVFLVEHTDELPWTAMDPLIKWIESYANNH